MCFFRKKKDNVVLSANQDRLKENIQAAEVFTATIPEGATGEKLKKLLDTLKYSSASRDEQVVALDKKISDKMGDLKIAINKAKNHDRFDAADALIEEIMLMLADRNSKIG